ncbi:MAG: hypothetical protein ACFB0Z_08960 [Candidatus Phaeomarinobacter sp.]
MTKTNINANLTRRSWLKRAGMGVGGIVVVATGGAVWRMADQGLLRNANPALEAWDDYADGKYKGPLAVIAAGVLAANPHNMQAWIFAASPTRIAVYVDTSRSLGAMDPGDRERMMGIGCALENMLHAAPAHGFTPALSLFPDQSQRDLVAAFDLRQIEPAPTPISEAIAHRKTNRRAYDPARSLDTRLIEAWQTAAAATDLQVLIADRETDLWQEMSSLTVEATEHIIADAHMSHDGHVWFRHDQDRIDRERDGVTLPTSGIPRWMEIAARTLPPLPEGVTQNAWLNSTQSVHLPTSAAVGTIMVAEADFYDDRTMIAAGRLWQHLHLIATTMGADMHPMNQIPERIAREGRSDQSTGLTDKVRTALGDSGDLPAFFFRAGYGAQDVPHSPRRTVDMVTRPI